MISGQTQHAQLIVFEPLLHDLATGQAVDCDAGHGRSPACGGEALEHTGLGAAGHKARYHLVLSGQEIFQRELNIREGFEQGGIELGVSRIVERVPGNTEDLVGCKSIRAQGVGGLYSCIECFIQLANERRVIIDRHGHLSLQ
jgi:hypothetical protein